MAWISRAESRSQPWESSTPRQRQPWENSADRTGAMVREHRPWESSAPISRDHPWLSRTEVTAFLRRDLPHLESLGATPMTLLPCGSLQPRNLADAIIATVVSTAAVVGGVALIVVSAGAATPGVAAAWGAAAAGSLGIGVAGTVNAGSGIHNGNFRWERWGTDVGFAAGTSLITFPTCFVGGSAIAGALIQGTRLSVTAAKSIALAAGSLAGAGIHEGSYIIKCEVEGREVETLELVLNGVTGAFEGGGAAYLGARVAAARAVRPRAPSSANATAGDYEGFHQEFFHNGQKRQVRILDRDGDLVRDIDYFHVRGGGHAGIDGSHVHDYGYNVNPNTGQLNAVRGRRGDMVRPLRPEDLPPPGSHLRT